jgi:hypothetical protein
METYLTLTILFKWILRASSVNYVPIVILYIFYKCLGRVTFHIENKYHTMLGKFLS